MNTMKERLRLFFDLVAEGELACNFGEKDLLSFAEAEVHLATIAQSARIAELEGARAKAIGKPSVGFTRDEEWLREANSEVVGQDESATVEAIGYALEELDRAPAHAEPQASLPSEKQRGIYRKFRVERTDGSSDPGGKHERCEYFVLDWMHDKFAVPAARAYADACSREFPELARDLRATANEVESLHRPADREGGER